MGEDELRVESQALSGTKWAFVLSFQFMCREHICEQLLGEQHTGRTEVTVQVTVGSDRRYLPCLLHFPCHTLGGQQGLRARSLGESWDSKLAFICFAFL